MRLRLTARRGGAAQGRTRLQGQQHRGLSASSERVSRDQVAEFRRAGFVKVDDLLSRDDVKRLGERFERLFAGDFDTGIYPDEWHWREGVSKPGAFREIVNGWKADSTVASVVLSPTLGRVAADLMGWRRGVRVAQDDILWKPPGGGPVLFHQDAPYISDQFSPREDNSLTMWIALDDADGETGVVEYCPGSHLWPRVGQLVRDSAFHCGDGRVDHRSPALQAARALQLDMPKVVQLQVAAGSAVCHHQDVWHGSGPNQSLLRHRKALGIHFVSADVKWRSSPHPDYIYGRYVLAGEDSPRDEFFPVVVSARSQDGVHDTLEDGLGAHDWGEGTSLLRRHVGALARGCHDHEDCSQVVHAASAGSAQVAGQLEQHARPFVAQPEPNELGVTASLPLTRSPRSSRLSQALAPPSAAAILRSSASAALS
ncbi:Probable alpha-ketoglutarate-dependent hypophosphite dioxygenase, partial [Durusdinium trenchii]